MIAEKTLSIIHFEDDRTTLNIVHDKLKKKYGASVKSESTLYNLKHYIESGLINTCDLIICDYCFRGEDIDPLLGDLANLNKTIVFNTCIEKDDFLSRVYAQLGFKPMNFVYTRKASREGWQRLLNEVEKVL